MDKLKPAMKRATGVIVHIMLSMRRVYEGDLDADFVMYILSCSSGSGYVIPSAKPSLRCIRGHLRSSSMRDHAAAHLQNSAAAKVLRRFRDRPEFVCSSFSEEDLCLKLYRRRTVNALMERKGWPMHLIPKKLLNLMLAIPNYRNIMHLTPQMQYDYNFDYAKSDVCIAALRMRHYNDDVCANCSVQDVPMNKCHRCKLRALEREVRRRPRLPRSHPRVEQSKPAATLKYLFDDFDRRFLFIIDEDYGIHTALFKGCHEG